MRQVCFAAAIMLVFCAAGCQTQANTSPAQTPTASNDTLSNGYSLLHELLGKQKNVNKLLWLKSVPEGLAELIKRSSTISAQGEQSIAQFAKENPTINLDQQNLPPIEQASRDAIESSTTRRLLTASGADFHKLLAIKQIEATEYGLHLAQVIAKEEADETRKTWLNNFEKSYTGLRDDFMDWLTDNTTGTAREVSSDGS